MFEEDVLSIFKELINDRKYIHQDRPDPKPKNNACNFEANKEGTICKTDVIYYDPRLRMNRNSIIFCLLHEEAHIRFPQKSNVIKFQIKFSFILLIFGLFILVASIIVAAVISSVIGFVVGLVTNLIVAKLVAGICGGILFLILAPCFWRKFGGYWYRRNKEVWHFDEFEADRYASEKLHEMDCTVNFRIVTSQISESTATCRSRKKDFYARCGDPIAKILHPSPEERLAKILERFPEPSPSSGCAGHLVAERSVPVAGILSG